MRVFFRGAAWVLLLAVSIFTLSPAELRPVSAAPVDWERFFAFAAVGGAFCLGYPKHRTRVFILVVCAAGLLEGLQELVPGRHGRLADGMFKVSGTLLGIIGGIAVERAMAGIRPARRP